MRKELNSALDPICDPIDYVGGGSGQFSYARRIHAYTAYPCHCYGFDQCHSDTESVVANEPC
jgi:hypothetical protein